MKKLLLIITTLSLSACNCAEAPIISAMETSDKKLSCKEIILEINEVEQTRKEAQAVKGIALGEILTPTCWISGYADGTKAIKNATSRIDYLGRIYDLLDCGGRHRRNSPPQQQYQQPAPQSQAPTEPSNQPQIVQQSQQQPLSQQTHNHS